MGRRNKGEVKERSREDQDELGRWAGRKEGRKDTKRGDGTITVRAD